MLIHQTVKALVSAVILSTGATAQTTTQSVFSFAHIAYGGGKWSTGLVFANTYTTPGTVTLSFFADSGAAVAVPIAGGNRQATLQVNVPAGGSARVEIPGDQGDPDTSAWVLLDLSQGAGIKGQGVFRRRAVGSPVWEAAIFMSGYEKPVCIIPLPGQVARRMLFPFDNTNGYFSGFGFANTSTSAKALNLKFYDESGAVITTIQRTPLPGHGHTAFNLTDYTILAGQKGVMEVTDNTSDIAAIGIMNNPDQTPSTIMPIMVGP